MSLPYSHSASRWLCLRPVLFLLTPSGLPMNTLETRFSWQKLTVFVVALCRRSLMRRLLRSMTFRFARWILRHFLDFGLHRSSRLDVFVIALPFLRSDFSS